MAVEQRARFLKEHSDNERSKPNHQPVAAKGAARLWTPKRVLFTPDALAEPFGKQIYERVQRLGLPVETLSSNRIGGLRGETERDSYRLAKTTLAVVKAPPGMLKLQPIPPSADWQFHLAQGCPAHCQYCYLAGSLSGPPLTRVYANLPEILASLGAYEGSGPTTFEVSCYTDPLSLEHLTGGLSECIRYFGTRQHGYLRWVSKFDGVTPLLELPHHGKTRCRMSVNAAPVSTRLEGGTAPVGARLGALRRLALPRAQGGGGYPVGLVIAPIMPVEGWQAHYRRLFEEIQEALDFPCDLSFELISHRFTPGSKEVLTAWYPNSSLDMDEAARTVKRNKFGGAKYVYRKNTMTALRGFFESEIATRFPKARVLYWT